MVSHREAVPDTVATCGGPSAVLSALVDGDRVQAAQPPTFGTCAVSEWKEPVYSMPLAALYPNFEQPKPFGPPRLSATSLVLLVK